MIYLILSLLVLTAGIIYWRYFYTYSKGYQTGLLQKFSYKGNVIKTYEGEMVVNSVPGNTYVAPTAERFYFSVTDNSLAELVNTLLGQMVVVHYKQKNGILFWHGSSEYLVDSIKRMT